MGKMRVPLAVDVNSRNGDILTKDSYILNGYVDKTSDGVYVSRRPGTTQVQAFGPGTVQGQFYFNGFEYVIVGDVLTRTSGGTLSKSSLTNCTLQLPQWSGRYGHVMLVFQDRMWVICGQTTSSTIGNDVWSTQDGITWALQTSTAGVGSRTGLGGCVFNNLMWIMGGFQGSTVYSDVWGSLDGVTWTLAVNPAPWGQRYYFCCVAANNGIYVYGGYNAANVAQNDVWFSSDGANWTKVNTVSTATFTPRAGAVGLYFNNLLWIIGGESSFGVYLNDVWSSPDGITWTKTTTAAFGTPRSHMAGCVYGNAMVIIGGISAGAPVKDVYRSLDGVTWFFVSTPAGYSAAFGFAAAVAFKSSPSVSQFRYDTVWTSGGQGLGGLPLQFCHYFNLDQNTSNSYSLFPTITGQFYQFNTFANGSKLIFKNQSNFWVLDAGTLTKVTDPNYPPQTVPGLPVLNDFAYVMTPDAEIHACAIDNPSLWPSLQFIVANFEDDKGTGLGKVLNYLVAFGTYTTQYFYDAGNPAPGIPISPYINANQKIGMVGQNTSGQPGFPTFANVGNTITFLGQTLAGFQGIYIINGTTPEKVSTPYIDKILIKDGAPTQPELIWVTSIGTGHNFIVCNLINSAYALVYSLEAKHWTIWGSAGFNSYFGGFQWYGNITVDEAQPATLWVGNIGFGGNACIFAASLGLFSDDGAIIDFRQQTSKLDFGSLVNKFFGEVDLVADQTTIPVPVTIQWSDDDYQTFSPGVTVLLSAQRPRANRLGVARRRAFRVLCGDTTGPLRFEALELTPSGGESG
jgi:hypothetical protein